MPDAIVCANDLIALGAMTRLREKGVEVPGTVAVTGVDDTVLGQISNPQLTSVRQPVGQIGAEAVRMLLSRAAQGPRVEPLAARTLVLDPQLLVRRSSDPAAPVSDVTATLVAGA